MQSLSPRAEVQSSSAYKLPIEVKHPQEPLQGWAVGGWRKSSDGGDVLKERSRSRAGDWRLNVQSTQPEKQVDSEAEKVAEIKDTVEVKLMIS